MKYLSALVICLLIFSSCTHFGTRKPAIDPVTGLDTLMQLAPGPEILSEEEMLIPYRKGDKWGFANTQKRIVIEPVYDYVQQFDNGYAQVGTKDSANWKYGLIDREGVLVVPIAYSFISKIRCNRFALQLDSGTVIVDNHFRRISSEYYDFVLRSFCKEDRIIVGKNKKRAVIDIHGNHITDYKYSKSWSYSDGTCMVRIGDSFSGKWGAIDTSGATVLDFEYDMLFPFEDGVSVAFKRLADSTGAKRNKWGVVNREGEEIIPFKYDYIVGDFKRDLCIAKYQDSKGKHIKSEIFDRSGKLLYSNKIEYYSEFKDGIAVFRKGDKYGIIDSKENVLIDPIYDWACNFSNGLAWVKQDNKYGFIDKENNVIIPLQYSSAYDYVYMSEDGVKVGKDSIEGYLYIDKDGKEYYEK